MIGSRLAIEGLAPIIRRGVRAVHENWTTAWPTGTALPSPNGARILSEGRSPGTGTPPSSGSPVPEIVEGEGAQHADVFLEEGEALAVDRENLAPYANPLSRIKMGANP